MDLINRNPRHEAGRFSKTLSVSIIVKNEESVIERCLSFCSKLADEIVVIDTGSTDKTKELASKFPKVKLFDSEYFNKDTHFSDFEFGKAKNEAVKKCTSDWICWVDADDFMDDENISKVRNIIESENRNCLYSFHVSYGGLRFEHCRLFTNHANILFDETHACHEYLVTLGNPLVIRHDVIVQHLPEHKHVSSQSRNVAIMEKDYFQRNRRDSRTCFYLANSYRESNEFLKAIEIYDKYLECSMWREERFFARYYKAQCLYRLGKTDDGKDEALRAIAEDGRFAEALCFMGDVFCAKRDWEMAILWYKMALATPYPENARLFVSRYSYSDYPAKKISECVARIGEKTSETLNAPKTEEKATEEPEKKISIRKEKYALPKDRGLALIAIKALSNCVTDSGGLVQIEVVPADDFQKEVVSVFDNLMTGEGEAKTLSIPVSLRGKHIQEWIVRSAGFMNVNMEPVRIANNLRIDKNLIVIGYGVCRLDEITNIVQEFGLPFVVLSEQSSFSDSISVLKNAAAYIGKAEWQQHLASWMSIPSFVFFLDKDPKEYGWSNQENRNGNDLSGLEEFLKGSCA